MTHSADTAMQMLLQSVHADHDAAIWHDNGRTVTRLARTAGVRVTFAHVDMAAGTVDYRTADGREVGA